MVFLIVGSTGAGKTTYAKELSVQMAAAVLSIDDWMKALYWQDMPSEPDNQWFVENSSWYLDRLHRSENQILKITLDRAQRHENTILDLGFSTSEHRKRFINILHEQNIPTEIHFLDITADVRWQRVLLRNQNKGDTFVMNVDRPMFDYIEAIFEPPHFSEGSVLKLIKTY